MPNFEYVHGPGLNAIIGGYVYRGSAIPELYGAYFFAERDGRVFSIRYDGSMVSDLQQFGVDFVQPTWQPVSFGEDSAGELYIADYGGRVYRIVETSDLEVLATNAQVVAGLGDTAILSATPSSVVGATAYMWFKDGDLTPLVNDMRISGADTPSLAIRDIEMTDAGTYVLRVDDESKAVALSDPIELIVVTELPLRVPFFVIGIAAIVFCFVAVALWRGGTGPWLRA